MTLWNTSMPEFRDPRFRGPERWRVVRHASRFRLALLFGLGCMRAALASGVEEERELKLVASTSFIGELCEALAGDDAHIRVLMPRGLNPHSYQPSPRDLAAIEDADRVFINGLGLEYQLRFSDDSKLINISEGIGALAADHDEHEDTDAQAHGHNEHGGVNPHLWFSPKNMMAGIRTIRTSLSDANPEMDEVYRAREKEYLQRLRLLDAQVREATMNLDEGSKRFVTDHPFLDYFARDYGFEIVGNIVDSVSDQAEPSAREISKLVNLLKEENIRAIFISTSSGRAMKSLAEAVVAESDRNIRIIELSAGSLAPIGERGSDYFDFIIYNTELIVGALSEE